MVIDGDVEELPARARGVIALAVAGDAMAGAHDASELLDVEMDEITRMLALVAAHGRGRLQGGKASAMAAQEAGDGGFGEPGGASDLEAWEPAAAQGQHAGDAERMDGFWGTLGARTTVQEAAAAFGAEAGKPLVSGALGNAQSSSRGGHGLMENDDAADSLGPTQSGELGLAVNVHAVLEFGLVLISQPHLPESSPHEQPIGTSHLGPLFQRVCPVSSHVPRESSPRCGQTR